MLFFIRMYTSIQSNRFQYNALEEEEEEEEEGFYSTNHVALSEW